MIFNTKCLWTYTITILIFANNLCQCKSAYGVLEDKNDIYDEHSTGDRNGITDEEAAHTETEGKRGWNSNFAVWGKRLYDENPANREEADLPIAQINPNKRKWAKFVSWGKRELPLVNDFESQGHESNNKREIEVLTEPLNIDESVVDTTQRLDGDIDKRKWQALTTWGKRRYNNMEGPYKSGWSSFTSWGKRDGESGLDDIDKRKWQFASWGKRNDNPYMDGIDKRKWAKFTSWGKREYDSLLDELDKRGRWAKFTSWGKRSEMNGDLEAAKKKWAKFTSWGKRENDLVNDEVAKSSDKERWYPLAGFGTKDDDEIDNVEKRKWSKFASWGKRPRNPKAWLALNTWGKRRWSGLTTWGKRSGNENKIETVARKLLRFFDLNEDGALDLDELHNYIRTLMSLPSKHETEVELPEVEE